MKKEPAGEICQLCAAYIGGFVDLARKVEHDPKTTECGHYEIVQSERFLNTTLSSLLSLIHLVPRSCHFFFVSIILLNIMVSSNIVHTSFCVLSGPK